MEEQQIDIVMATYNGEEFIEEQLDSILSQTYKNFNLIISDDKSTDNTVEILKKYEKKDNRIKIYLQEKNLGFVKNFEFLLKQVKNELYMLCDQDDVWLPEKVEKTHKKLLQEKADLVFTDLKVVDENLNIIHDSFNEYMKYQKKAIKYNDYRLEYLYNCITGNTIMSKKVFLDRILPIPIDSKNLRHDHWISLIVSLEGKIVYLNEQLVMYRQHQNNQVGIKKKNRRNIEQLRNKIINIKLEQFNVYYKHNSKLIKELQQLNSEALEYFIIVNRAKYINMRKLNIFHKLYKNETLSFYVLSFILLNIPIIQKMFFFRRDKE